jgi:hypothetical protein
MSLTLLCDMIVMGSVQSHTLPPGGFFGELALLATARRTAQCTALANCDLSLLMAHDLVAAMRDFPESAAKVGVVNVVHVQACAVP